METATPVHQVTQTTLYRAQYVAHGRDQLYKNPEVVVHMACCFYLTSHQEILTVSIQLKCQNVIIQIPPEPPGTRPAAVCPLTRKIKHLVIATRKAIHI